MRTLRKLSKAQEAEERVLLALQLLGYIEELSFSDEGAEGFVASAFLCRAKDALNEKAL